MSLCISFHIDFMPVAFSSHTWRSFTVWAHPADVRYPYTIFDCLHGREDSLYKIDIVEETESSKRQSTSLSSTMLMDLDTPIGESVVKVLSYVHNGEPKIPVLSSLLSSRCILSIKQNIKFNFNIFTQTITMNSNLLAFTCFLFPPRRKFLAESN